MTSLDCLKHRDGSIAGQKFRHGLLATTDRAWNCLAQCDLTPYNLVQRHVQGDFGDLEPVDRARNERAIGSGARVFSSYDVAEGVSVWVITEADRSVTTVLMPGEY